MHEQVAVPDGSAQVTEERELLGEVALELVDATLGMLARCSVVAPIQVGLGMQIGSIDTLFTQGNIETTGATTERNTNVSSSVAMWLPSESASARMMILP